MVTAVEHVKLLRNDISDLNKAINSALSRSQAVVIYSRQLIDRIDDFKYTYAKQNKEPKTSEDEKLLKDFVGDMDFICERSSRAYGAIFDLMNQLSHMGLSKWRTAEPDKIRNLANKIDRMLVPVSDKIVEAAKRIPYYEAHILKVDGGWLGENTPKSLVSIHESTDIMAKRCRSCKMALVDVVLCMNELADFKDEIELQSKF